MELQHKSHNVGEASYHIVFRPKYSHPIFGYYEPLRKFCETKFRMISEQYGFEIRALEIMDDHVHLFVGIGPTSSVSSVVQKFKGISAHEMFDQFRWLKECKPGEPRFWGGNFWSRGYFYRSVGSTTDEAVKFYINVSQDKEKRKKYYRNGGSSGDICSEDPYVKHLKVSSQTKSIDESQTDLTDFSM
ncbi:MAG: IS200/IS605 family transposase [Candidatus Saliniplasma sp.]